ncbi:hypothetical protein [Lysobacter enzymogenes]|uniref:Protein containing StAR-related lipid-transfer domain n=1 Tax=Lysobacter enzymogenes TaxID=69 RepID=A0AAU9AIX5_LYSEN|nr:hypothetical protein [Lysobacter enzymogenes]BAV98087.1 protein containing StAR-related lipid-transfer domain [Lysobacter enzymogenes]
MAVTDIPLAATPAPAAQAQAQARPRGKLRRLLRAAPYLAAIAVIGVFAANLAWRASGSNQWQLELEKSGVKVYSLKSPGAYNKQYKAVMRGKYTLNQLVGGLIENSTEENCKQHIPGCLQVQVIRPWNSRTMSDTVLWKLQMPPPFAPRESVIRSQVSQDPKTLAVTVDVIAAPNAIARNPGAVRLTHMQNQWLYTPLGNGEVEIQFLQDIDMGGFFPAILLNLAGAQQTYMFIHDQLPGLLDMPAVKQARYDFIQEAR